MALTGYVYHRTGADIKEVIWQLQAMSTTEQELILEG